MTPTQSKDSNRRAAARRTSKPRSSGSPASSSSGSNSAPDPTVTESKVQARVALEEGTGFVNTLEERAREQEKRQAKELRDGVATGAEKKSHDDRVKRGKKDRASLRAPAGVEQRGPVAGLVDQTTARSDEDALQGHFVQIDLSVDGVPDEVRERGNVFGVFVEVATTDPETGYPATVQVRMRDETNALVVVPYEALSRTEYRGR